MSAELPTADVNLSATDRALIDNLETLLTALGANTDTVESLLGTISGALDGSPALSVQSTSLETRLDSILTELGQKLEAGGEVALSAASLAALESITATISGTVETRGQRGALTDRSGTITTGGSSQQLAAANASRSYLFIQNVSTGDLWVRFGAAAAASQPSIKLAAGASLVAKGDGFIPTESVNIVGATTAQAFSAKEA